MRRTLLMAVVLPTLAGACATTEPDQQVAMNESKLVCTREAPTGSKIPVTRCRTPEDIEAQRRVDKETADNIPTALHDVLTGR
jgi:hypothetical protein